MPSSRGTSQAPIEGKHLQYDIFRDALYYDLPRR